MGQKSLVNQSFQFKKNLTTEGNPYIATAQIGFQMPVTWFKGSKFKGSEVR
jgi:hypothetical protein